MEPIWLNICSVLLVFTFAIISPGPNFILVLNRSLTGSRRTGVYSALGVATGSALFAIAGLLGMLVLINALPYFSLVIRYAGSSYLIYLGVTMLLACRQQPLAMNQNLATTSPVPPFTAYLSGLLTNLTNPKAWAFYLSLFSLYIESDFPLWSIIFLAISIFLIAFVWYALVAFLSSDQRIQMRPGLQPLVKSGLGTLLILLGGKLILKG